MAINHDESHLTKLDRHEIDAIVGVTPRRAMYLLGRSLGQKLQNAVPRNRQSSP